MRRKRSPTKSPHHQQKNSKERTSRSTQTRLSDQTAQKAPFLGEASTASSALSLHRSNNSKPKTMRLLHEPVQIKPFFRTESADEPFVATDHGGGHNATPQYHRIDHLYARNDSNEQSRRFFEHFRLYVTYTHSKILKGFFHNNRRK